MSKNMTRKGLAIGSAFALGASALVASPAYAVSDISLGAYWGSTSSNALVAVQDAKNGLVLSTELANFGSATDDNLKYLVEIVTADTAVSDLDAGSNDFNVYTQVSSRLSSGGRLELTTNGAIAETTTTFTSGGKNYFVIDPVYKGTATVSVSAGTYTSDSATAATVTLTVGEGHGFVVGDDITLGGTLILPSSGSDDDLTSGSTVGSISSVTATTITFPVTALAGITAAGSATALETVTSATARLTSAVDAPKSTLNHLLYINVPAFDGSDSDSTLDDTLTLNITAWIDEVGDNRIGNEFKSSTISVSFIPEKDVEFAGSFDYAFVTQVTGTTPLTGSFTSNINTENWFEVHNEQETTANALNVDVAGPGSNDDASNTVSYSSVLNALTFSATGAGTLAAGDYVATLQAGSATLTGATSPFFTGATAEESAAELTLAAASLTGTGAALELTAATGSSVAQDTGLIGGAGKVVALEGTKTLDFTVQAKSSTTTAAGSGVKVNVTIDDTLAASGTAVSNANTSLGTTTITAGGKTLKATGDNTITFQLTTDVNGRVTFQVTADNAKDGEGFRITVQAEGDESDFTTVEWDKAAVQLVAYPTSASSGSGTLQVAPGGSTTVAMRVSDQFGNVPAGTHQVAVTRAAVAGTTAQRDELAEYANWSYVVPVAADGRASVTITDNGSATLEGSDTVTLQVQSLATAGGGYVNATGSAATKSFTLRYENDLKTAALAAKANNNGVLKGTVSVKPIALETDAVVNWDSRIDAVSARPEYENNNTFSSLTAASANDGLVAISGTVKTAAGLGISNVPVTISSTGLVFADTADTATSNWFIKDSVTVNSTSGDFIVYVRGTVSGKRTVTITAGALSTTVDLTFAAGSVSATKMDLTVPATSGVNRSVDVVAKITDDNGNPAEGVTVTFKEAGAGYLNTSSAVTDATGEARVNLITLAGDTGTSTITATATLKGVSTSVSKTLTIGAPVGGKVNVGSFNGKLVVYAAGLNGSRISWKVGGNWGSAVASSDYAIFNRPTPRAGVTVSVEIYVDGVLTLTKSVLTR